MIKEQSKGVKMHKLEIIDLTKNYGEVLALNKINATFTDGIYGILGRNGAGKTTLFRTLVGLLKPSNGMVKYYVDEKKVSDREFEKHIGYLPQEFGMYKYYTIQEVMNELCIVRGIPKKNRKDEIDRLLKLVNLSDDRKKKVGALSGGMKRRLGLAQSMIGDPDVLIVDEPTAGVDPEERIRIRQLLSDYAINHIVLISTHIVEDIAHICDSVIILEHGNKKYDGKINNLIEEAKGSLNQVIFKSLSEFQEFAKDNEIISFYREDQKVRAVVTNDNYDSATAIGLEDAYMWAIKGK